VTSLDSLGVLAATQQGVAFVIWTGIETYNNQTGEPPGPAPRAPRSREPPAAAPERPGPPPHSPQTRRSGARGAGRT